MLLKKIFKHYKQGTLNEKILQKFISFLNDILNKTRKVQEKNNPIPFIKELPSNDFVEFEANANTINSMVKTIAFYLPQFHPFEENDAFWGKGFTEWTNVTKAVPNFKEHNQPRFPIHLGYYDLRLLENIKEQAFLAKNYGLYGFCIYYYWFSGKKVMDTPLKLIFNNKDLDTKYCLSWANENWTRRWDGKNDDILLEQLYDKDDPVKLINDIYIYFKDSRYIKIGNKPVLLIYKADEIPNLKRVIKIWRNEIQKHGFEDIYLVGTRSFGFTNKEGYDFNAMVDFPPHNPSDLAMLGPSVSHVSSNFSGQIFDYNLTAQERIKNYKSSTFIKTAMLGFDNTPRKQNQSMIFHNFSPLKFKQWIGGILNHTIKNNAIIEKFVFINAWNEWGEGTYLEPDRKHGFSNLKALHQMLLSTDKKFQNYYSFKNRIKTQSLALVYHLYYLDCLDLLIKHLDNIEIKFDVYITITADVVNDSIIKTIESKIRNAHILIVENRGRDVLPFIEVFKHILKLNYDFICKIHSKKTVYKSNGGQFYPHLLKVLLQPSNIQRVTDNNKETGLFIPEKFALKLNQNISAGNVLNGNQENLEFLCQLMKIQFNTEEYFPAGTMFWANPQALKQIVLIEESIFNFENGLLNGDIPHAIERVFGLLVKHNGYKIELL